MAIWKLQPVNVEDPNWEASTYKGDVLIRAESEAIARRIAAHAFGRAAEVKIFPEKSAVVPWDVNHFVSVEKIQTSDFEEDGAEIILDICDIWGQSKNSLIHDAGIITLTPTTTTNLAPLIYAW